MNKRRILLLVSALIACTVASTLFIWPDRVSSLHILGLIVAAALGYLSLQEKENE